MSQNDDVIDLDYDSPLENLFWFLGSPWCIGLIFLATWFLMVSYGKDGRPPIWPDFPVTKFFLIMFGIWTVGFFLKVSYDVRYQLDPRTQQLELVRNIRGCPFKSRIAGFSQLHSSAVLCTWADGKQGERSWMYALALITVSGRVVRVSSYGSLFPCERAEEIASKLGTAYVRCRPTSGTLKVRRARSGELVIQYKPAPRTSSEQLSFLNKDIGLGGCLLGTGVVTLFFVVFWFYGHSS